jgi:cobalt-precorrin-5B (C1)-methyltransferase
MREGFTTGSCAAAAALASCLWRRDGECPPRVEITLPGGRIFQTGVFPRGPYVCGVTKDAGDDPDITHGCEARVLVEIGGGDGGISFKAGEGVGVVTKPGLKIPVGEAAVNPVPRRMIAQAVRSVYPSRAAVVTVSIPGGGELARRTYNPRLGVAGGLSILGTTGVVRPMSEDALTETIALELSVIRSRGVDAAALVFGSQGEDALARLYPGIPVAQMSNYVGFALDECAGLGFARLLVAGHPGKLAKVSAGATHTHSGYGDARREAIITHLALMGAGVDLMKDVYECVTTDAAIGLIDRAGRRDVWNRMADAAQSYCEARIRGAAAVDIIFMDGGGLPLGFSKRIREDAERWNRAT